MFQRKVMRLMDKKIGKKIIAFLCMLTSLTFASVSWQISDMQQQRIDHAQIDIPFMLQVVVDGESCTQVSGLDSTQDADIQFLGPQSVSMNINGKVTQNTRYIYLVTAHTKKNMQFGPVSVTLANGVIKKIDAFTIVVKDILPPDYSKKETYVLVVQSDRKKAYIGEKIKCFLRFCYQASFDSLSIETPIIKNIIMGHQQQSLQQAQTVLGGHEYPCKELYFEIYPQQLSTLVIPPFKATFIAGQQQKQQSQLFSFFGFQSAKTITSHPWAIEIMPLPKSPNGSDVKAIGTFSSMQAQLDQNKGKVGEGIIFKLTVEGNGNLEIVKAPTICLPEDIHYYEGNSFNARIDDDNSKKTFEWIVQVDKPGHYIIPAQHFMYFNPDKNAYVTISSKPLSLDIHGTVQTVDQQDKKSTKETKLSLEKNKQLPSVIEQDISTVAVQPTGKKTASFLWLLIVLLGIIVALLIMVACVKRYMRDFFFVRALYNRWEFYDLCKAGDIEKIYQFFERLGVTYGFGLQSPQLQDCFAKQGLSQETFENWQNFLQALLIVNFDKTSVQKNASTLVNLAKQWFPIILSCCKRMYKQLPSRHPRA